MNLQTESQRRRVDEQRRERFGRFRDLMLWRCDKILLVSSAYDSFMLAEDRLIDEVVLREFLGIDLYSIPDLIRVPTIAEAVELVTRTGGFDIVITSPYLVDGNAAELARAIHDEGIPIPVILLAYHDSELRRFVEEQDVSDLDRSFLFQGDIDLLLAIVKYVEDRMNVAHDVDVMGVQAIILVEDNIRYYSSLLPWVYKELMSHTRGLVPEGVNLAHKLMRVKARPKVLLCSNYEEAREHFERYRENILGVISDVEFPRDGQQCADAGVQFAEAVHGSHPDIPVVLHSGKPENAELAPEVGATFLLKGSPTLLKELREYMLENFGFGDFVFRMPDGAEVDRASDLKSLERVIARVPAESLLHHAERNHFSTWLKAHTEFGIALRLRPLTKEDFAGAEEIREYLMGVVSRHREDRRRAVVTDFDPRRFESDRGFARIGGGSLGGKARGLAFANWLINESGLEEQFGGVRIAVPTSVVLGTDVFDQFLDDNELRSAAITSEDDEELERAFRAAPFTPECREELGAFLETARFPLAVRSSSLLEDAKFEPFAGIYETILIPNAHPDAEVRLEQLITAIKRVYASTFSQKAKRHMRATNYRLEEEKMAVIVQRVVGARHSERFYPDFAGVALSENYYPVGPVQRGDGLAAVAIGLGGQVVEGGECIRFSPRYPERLVQMSSVKDALQSSQRQFRAMRLDSETTGRQTLEAELESYDLKVAEEDGTLALTGSTYSADNDVVYDGIGRPGIRLVSFAGVLKHGAFPLAPILEEILSLGVRAVGGPVEIEFAVNLTVPEDEPAQFGFLQIRPIPRLVDPSGRELEMLDREDVICVSDQVLGNGLVEGIRDVVMVDIATFDRSDSRNVAQRVAILNSKLEREGSPYLLIGVGRWGSADPHLGIPVTWDEIAGARAIVECGFRDVYVEPSQGTHFFQNLIAHEIGYFTVNPHEGEGSLDWDWLREQPLVEDRGSVRGIRRAEPARILMAASRRRGVILKPDPPREVDPSGARQDD